MRELEVKFKEGKEEITLVLDPLDSEPNLWKIKAQEDPEKLRGLIMTYVDDIFITAPPSIRDAFKCKIQQTWTTSRPEDVTSLPVKFLGMEVSVEEKIDGGHVWTITQSSYLTDLLAEEGQGLKKKKIPITRDQSQMEKDEVTTPEGVGSPRKSWGKCYGWSREQGLMSCMELPA